MKTILKTVLFLLLVTTIGCSKENENIPINESDKLIGHWINPIYTGSELQLSRASSLKADEYGLSFLEKTQCVERSSGWCGTPPITFMDFQGTYTKNDSIIIITIDNGTQNIKWKIKTLNDKTLIMERM
ncbi:MAG: hypothetical protein GZ087_14695 [Flavobacterium sp.]|nr:hypothetical protein [Flavobacterium sp.]